MPSTTYTITIKAFCSTQNLGLPVNWDWEIKCGEKVIFSGCTHSEQSAYIFAGSALSRISGESTEIEIKTIETKPSCVQKPEVTPEYSDKQSKW